MTEKSDQTFQTHIGRVRGLGSAKEGTDHWWGLRLTSLALVPLYLWFVYSVVTLIGASYGELKEWMAQPFNTVVLIALMIATFHHAYAGSQEIVEDYISHKGFKLLKLASMKAVMLIATIVSVVSILKVAFVG